MQLPCTYNKVKHITFRVIKITDAEFILSLRLNPQKNKFLSPIKNNIKEQEKWIEAYKKREKKKQEYYYIIMDKKERLGAVRLYDFKGNSFSWGSWVLKEGVPAYAAIESALLVYEIGFFALGFKFSHFDVIKHNKKIITFHTRFGASIVHQDDKKYYFNFDKRKYEYIKFKYIKFIKK